MRTREVRPATSSSRRGGSKEKKGKERKNTMGGWRDSEVHELKQRKLKTESLEKRTSWVVSQQPTSKSRKIKRFISK